MFVSARKGVATTGRAVMSRAAFKARIPDEYAVLHTGQSIMFIETCTGGVLLHVSIRTCQKEFRLMEKGGRLLAHVASEPERDRANKELVNGLKNIFNQPVFLVSGTKSKSKKLKIESITAEAAMQILNGIAGK